jgi:hypothetical protein
VHVFASALAAAAACAALAAQTDGLWLDNGLETWRHTLVWLWLASAVFSLAAVARAAWGRAALAKAVSGAGAGGRGGTGAGTGADPGCIVRACALSALLMPRFWPDLPAALPMAYWCIVLASGGGWLTMALAPAGRRWVFWACAVGLLGRWALEPALR